MNEQAGFYCLGFMDARESTKRMGFKRMNSTTKEKEL